MKIICCAPTALGWYARYKVHPPSSINIYATHGVFLRLSICFPWASYGCCQFSFISFFFLSPLDPYKTWNHRVRFVVARAWVIVKRRSRCILDSFSGRLFSCEFREIVGIHFRRVFYVPLLPRGIILSASRGITGTDRRWIVPSYIGQLPREIRWLDCTYSFHRVFWTDKRQPGVIIKCKFILSSRWV